MMYSERARELRRCVAPHSPHRPAKTAYVPCTCQATAAPIDYIVVLHIVG